MKVRKGIQKWLVQAESDLKAARDSLEDAHYDWCCFQSQQGVEKALKAFLYERGYTSVVTHSLKELVRECKRLERAFEEVEGQAHFLDMFYIPTRYPNGLAGDMAPSEFYERGDAEKCLSCAASILSVVKRFLRP